MRCGALIVVSGILAVATGCGQSRPVAAAAPAAESSATSNPTPAIDARGIEPPPSLWTRKTGGDWPIFLGPNQDSKSSETGIIKKWDAKRPQLLWHQELGTSYGAPTIAGGRLFQFDRFGSNSRLYCLNAETGAELWKHEGLTSYHDQYGYNNGPRCSPVVDGGLVYAYGVDGVLVCCRVEDGRMVWQRDVNNEFGVVQNFFGVGSTPVIEGDLLIVMVGGSPAESQQVPPGALDRVDPNGSGIVAFDKVTGAVKYKLADELASYASLKLATIGERRWCFAFMRGGLAGFEPTAGTLDFHYPWRDRGLESVNASMPVVAGDEVLISETYGPGSTMLKVEPGKHRVVWKDDERRRDKAMQTHWMTAVEHEGYLYGSSGRHSENAELRCIEWKTGKVMWSQPGMARTSLLLIDGHFVFDGDQVAIDGAEVTYESLCGVCYLEESGGVLNGRH